MHDPELTADCKLYDRLVHGESPPKRDEIDDVIHAMVSRYWKDWPYIVDKVEALAEDLDLRAWYEQARYARMHLRRMEAER